ncbi:MAG: hypothetical protein CMJ18_00570 [Phycisphaeraceae bacterium]|nr:hypothetical protein [Phycisphaeraceae bacterium]
MTLGRTTISITILAVVATFVVGTHSVEAAIFGNPAGAWLFDGDLTDATQNGNDGVLGTGTETYEAVSVPFPGAYPANSSLFLDGASAVTVAPDAAIQTQTGSFSVQAWAVRRASFQTVLAKRTAGTSANWELIMGNDANPFRWQLGGSNSTVTLEHSVAGNFGTWHQYVLVVDRSTDQAHFYYDGALADTESIAGIGDLDGGGAGHQLIVGSSSALSNPFVGILNGTVDEVAIYQRALGASDVQTMFNNTLFPEPGALVMLCLGVGVLTGSRRTRNA